MERFKVKAKYIGLFHKMFVELKVFCNTQVIQVISHLIHYFKQQREIEALDFSILWYCIAT